MPRKILGSIGKQDVDAVAQVETLGTDRGGYHRPAQRQGLEDLYARTAAVADGDDDEIRCGVMGLDRRHAADDGHACAVTLFAAGCDVAPTAIPLAPPPELSAARVAAFTELLLTRTLRGPERVCGPPALA